MDELLDVAKSSTTVELERVGRVRRGAPSADLDCANRVHARRYLSWWWDEDGALRLHGRLTAEDGAALIEAIETAAEALHGSLTAPPDAPDCEPSQIPSLGAR